MNKTLLWAGVSVAIMAAVVAFVLMSGEPPASPVAVEATDATPAPAQPATPAPASRRPVSGPRIERADFEPRNWMTHGRTYDEQRFSPLDRVNEGNVESLALAWYVDLPTRRGLEATPLVVDGRMYTTGAWSVVYALDAATGEELWTYDPEVPRSHGALACCDVVNRGVALWNQNVYVATLDGRLLALDAGTGSLVWETPSTDPALPYTIVGAPRVVKEHVIIGNSGARFGVRGYVSAYDVRTGELAWRFYTVPGDPEQPSESQALERAAATWEGDAWWRDGGAGGTVSDAIAYDPALGLLYIGTGGGSPTSRFARSPGGGDNLYLSSIIALNPDSGEYVWHYQTTPGETRGYGATQHLMLAELPMEGGSRKVLMQAAMNGFFYILDAATGELLSADSFVPVNWATGVDLETGRPVENPGADFATLPQFTMPSPFGAHNWQPMAFHPGNGLVYVPTIEMPWVFGQDRGFRHRPNRWNSGTDAMLAALPDDPADAQKALEPIGGALIAWDPIRRRQTWRVEHAGAWNGGLLSTAGNLIFQGTADGRLNAWSATSGRRLWYAETQTGVTAPPITYAVDDEQYVAVMAGWGGWFALAGGRAALTPGMRNVSRVLVYKAGGTASLPPLPDMPPLPEPPVMQVSAGELVVGKKLYHDHCAVCHGEGAVSAGVLPDLRRLSQNQHAQWEDIVLNGSLAEQGMPGFSSELIDSDAEAIRAYVIKRARDES
ncbi:MAG: PQQ-dependent dehydrogenase, methanol/ethanol family [Pseudomonadota bacterium]